MRELTKMQSKRLREIAAFVPKDDRWPLPAFWQGAPTDRSLVKRGLVERVTHTTKLRSDIGFTWHLCRLTEAGRRALSDQQVKL